MPMQGKPLAKDAVYTFYESPPPDLPQEAWDAVFAAAEEEPNA